MVSCSREQLAALPRLPMYRGVVIVEREKLLALDDEIERLRRALERAGLKPELPKGTRPTTEQAAQFEAMHNVLRHSFATYHLAACKDAAKTAVLLTHRNPSMLYQFYKGRASEAEGKAYFEIGP